jgi:DNA-binding PadR family transcriptional regulator
MPRYIKYLLAPLGNVPGGEGVFVYNMPPKSQEAVLRHLLLNGPETLYGFHKKLNMSISTVGSALEKLNNAGAISSEMRIENGRNKKYCSLTLCGLSWTAILLHEHENEELMKTQISCGIENWSSLCPEFFNHWNELIDDTESPGASDYWFDIMHSVFLICAEDHGLGLRNEFFGAIALIIWERWIIKGGNIDRRAVDTLREIPEIWDTLHPLLCRLREYHRETMKKIDTLLL